MNALRFIIYQRILRKSLTPRRVINVFKAFAEYNRRSIVVHACPVYLVLETCSACSLRCPECIHGDNKIPKTTYGMMDVDLFRALVEKYHHTVLIADLFNWGEPLLNKRLPELVRLCSRHKITTTIHTVLNHLSPEYAKRLIASGLDVLVVSIDAATSESYSKYRKGGDFNKAIENLKHIAELSRTVPSPPSIVWKYLIFPHNKHELGAARKMAKEIGVKFYSEVGRLTDSYEPASSVIATKLGSKKQNTPCHYLWSMPAVNWDGRVFPCCRVYEPKDAYDQVSVENATFNWNGRAFQESRRLFLSPEQPATELPCLQCHRYLSYWNKNGAIPRLIENREAVPKLVQIESVGRILEKETGHEMGEPYSEGPAKE